MFLPQIFFIALGIAGVGIIIAVIFGPAVAKTVSPFLVVAVVTIFLLVRRR